jgi:hypothetical protein
MEQYNYNIHNNENTIRKDLSKMPQDFVRKLDIKDLSQFSYKPTHSFNGCVVTATGDKLTIDPDDFHKSFSNKTHDMLSYVSWDNILMAGGAVTNILTSSKEKINDIDLFIYGLGLDSAKNKIDRIVTQIKQRAESKSYETRIYQNSHVVNIYIFSVKKVLEIQIILRLYNRMEEVLMGFDVDSCCVGYDGKYILTTERNLFSFQNRTNIADISRRSPSYESRLIKYSTRGFDVITNFNYKPSYNKLFFMNNNNNGFVRLLEQELINNGKSKDIVFSNTLRFRKPKGVIYENSNYSKFAVNIRYIKDIESSITKHNATIEDENLKFSEYNKEKMCMMTENVMDQFTGSFNPITTDEWLYSDETMDMLGRTQHQLAIKYSSYRSISEFENVPVTDMSNFDAKAMAVMYLNDEKDVVRMVDNKYVPASKNMYNISPLALAILLGRTSLAIKLSKGYSWENYKEIIYLMDNDKLYAHYCKATIKSYRDIDQSLADRYRCANISANIHKQGEAESALSLYYKKSVPQRLCELKKGNLYYSLSSIDYNQLSLEEMQNLYKLYSSTIQTKLCQLVKRNFDRELYDKARNLLEERRETSIFDFLSQELTQCENKKNEETSRKATKLLMVNGVWKDEFAKVSVPNIYSLDSGLLYCMKYIDNVTIEEIKELVGDTGYNFDRLVHYVIYHDNVPCLEKVMNGKDMYVSLKYKYNIPENGKQKIKTYFENLVKTRDAEKQKVNKLVKNTTTHIEALNEGVLPENYVRAENIFGMTQDDNILAKLLLIYNKVFNKKESLSERDLESLINLRKAVLNINRNIRPLKVKKEYFFSEKLDRLFFGKNIEEDLIDDNNDENDAQSTADDYDVLSNVEITRPSNQNYNDLDDDNDYFNDDTAYQPVVTKSKEPKKMAKKCAIKYKSKCKANRKIGDDSDSDSSEEYKPKLALKKMAKKCNSKCKSSFKCKPNYEEDESTDDSDESDDSLESDDETGLPVAKISVSVDSKEPKKTKDNSYSDSCSDEDSDSCEDNE